MPQLSDGRIVPPPPPPTRHIEPRTPFLDAAWLVLIAAVLINLGFLIGVWYATVHTGGA